MSNVVLLVEDSDFIRDMYKLKLTKAKIDVLEAVDGSMALSMISEHKPKLVLLDLMMPNVTGLEVLEELDKQKMTP
ncbi:MAG: response regulator, partial [Patescibacteria group bacterium]|nr:response regulator [Patescibacteria group bacterium]